MNNAASLVIRAFHAVMGDVFAHGHTHYWFKGGRGSTKSSFISICIVLLIVAFPYANAVILRRFGNTIKDSVVEQIAWSIEALGLSPYFRALKSPHEFVYLPTGQRIIFRGLDDPLKAKSVKFRKGYCAIVWLEELDQFASWEFVQSTLKSFLRGGSVFWVFYSYNPPRTLWSWVNAQALKMEERKDAIVNHSTYLDVVESGCQDWLGDQFLVEAEIDKEANLTHYRWEMLGEITGTGGSVFDNVLAEPISQAEIRGFEGHRNGVDWGWFPDPWRFIRCNYVPRNRTLYIYEEHEAYRKEPRDTGQVIVDALTYADEEGSNPYYHNQQIWCDDTADGKQQIATYKRLYGLQARPSPKSNMRDLSYRWLAGLNAIVIDPKRCPLTYEEFVLKEFEKDSNGNWIDSIPDGNDHSIDAVRYAVMNDVRRDL